MADFPDAPMQGQDDDEEGGGRFQEINDDDDGDDGDVPKTTTTTKAKRTRWNHLLASTGDDGSLKVWRLPTAEEVKSKRTA